MPNRLETKLLYHVCDAQQLGFRTTDEVDEPDISFGQNRALKALEFGIGIQRSGYNLYVLGPHGAGKQAFIHRLLDSRTASEPTPNDWVYVHNFKVENQPRAICLSPGKGRELRLTMDWLIETLLDTIPVAFESDAYQEDISQIEEDFVKSREEALSRIRKAAQKENIDLIRTAKGFAFVPLIDNKIVDDVSYDQLPEATRTHIEKVINELETDLQSTLQQIPRWQQEARQKIKTLNREVTQSAIHSIIQDIRNQYKHEEVSHYLSEVENDITDNSGVFRTIASNMVPGDHNIVEEPFLKRYRVNIVVDQSEQQGPPIVYESNPNYNNLIGKVEYNAQMGTLTTDFTLIKPGALHRANGGYLIIDADKILTRPMAWDALKSALASREIRIEALQQTLGLANTVSLEPEPIPVDLKIILTGERMVYYLLSEYDPEFNRLFKVAADFSDRIDRNERNDQLYAQLIANLVKKEKLIPFENTAVARIIEHGSRVVEDSKKLSAHLGELSNLTLESEYWAQQAGMDIVTHTHVEQAIEQQRYRMSRFDDAVQESIERGVTLIDTEGSKAGQINGLSIIQLGQTSVGQPSRITATARMGDGKVIDIEQESDLGGETHTKGVLILSHFLAARYARSKNLSISASIAFEQSYGGVDGDSASMGELCALLSAIADLPVKQCFAVTGSINQLGEIQAIGGVNEKIEGFFDTCKRRGLTGDQGVIIPTTNIEHLMLRKDVVAACDDKQFHIYAVSTIDQALELLMEGEAGVRDETGAFPADSINGKVEKALLDMAEAEEHEHEHDHDKKEIAPSQDEDNDKDNPQ